MPNETRTLLVKSRTEGTFKITIPADWKVTFSSFQQGKSFDDTPALRLYESESKQRACFRNVESFRDLGIPLTRLIKETTGETRWEDDGEGNTSRSEKKKTKLREVSE